MLFEGYSEGTTTDIRADHPSEEYREHYEYPSDSDLEDDPELADVKDEESSQAGEADAPEDSTDGINPDDEDQRQSNHRDPFDLDVFPHPSEDLSDIYVHPVTADERWAQDNSLSQPYRISSRYEPEDQPEGNEPNNEIDRPVHLGKVVMIKDAAHTTWVQEQKNSEIYSTETSPVFKPSSSSFTLER